MQTAQQPEEEVPAFVTLADVQGIHVDAVVADRDAGLYFLSAYGRDTAIQELFGRLSVSPQAGGLEALSFNLPDGRSQSVPLPNRERLEKLTGRVAGSIFGKLVHVFIYDALVQLPDFANRRALLLSQPDEEATLPERIWELVKEVCHVPLLNHWRETVMQSFTSEGLIERLDGMNLGATRIHLPPDQVEPLISRLIQRGQLTLDPADQPPAPAARPDPSEEWEVISTYTREQAIDDGVLIDVSEVASEAGFKLPVAVTAAVWSDCVAWTEEDTDAQTYQDQPGRLWDVIWMAKHAARSAASGQSTVLYQLLRVPRDGKSNKPEEITLKMIIGPGDSGEPVITILQPGED